MALGFPGGQTNSRTYSSTVSVTNNRSKLRNRISPYGVVEVMKGLAKMRATREVNHFFSEGPSLSEL